MSTTGNLPCDVPLEAPVPTVPLELILCTGLHQRSPRPRDLEKESSALATLTGALAADSADTILQTLAQAILNLTESDSAGLSLLTTTHDGGKQLRWAAIAGAWEPYIGRQTPLNLAPDGCVLAHDRPLLFRHFERRYRDLLALVPAAEECLMVPFHVRGIPVGTTWAIMHGDRRKLDSEDERIMRLLGNFAAAAYHTIESRDHLQLLAQQTQALADARLCLTEEQRRLQRTDAQLAAAQKLNRTGHWCLNVATGEIGWSPGLFAMLGFDIATTRPSYELLLDRVDPEERSHFDRLRATADGGIVEAEYRLLLPGGVRRSVEHIGQCSLNAAGEPECIGTLTDITHRKRVEQRHRFSRAFFALSQRLSRTGAFSWRVSTGRMICSDELYSILGYPPELPVTPELIRARVHPDDTRLLQSMLDCVHKAATHFEGECRLQMPDRSVKHIHIAAQGISDDAAQTYVGAIQDVTERRLAEQALSSARLELAHAARVASLGTLTASIAHEINQPLSGIVTNANACLRMLMDERRNIEAARETARRMIRDAGRAADVMKRLRALFTKETDTSEPVNINDAILEVLALLSRELEQARVVVRLELAGAIPLVCGDRIQLQQVILNLLLNAKEAMMDVDDRPRRLGIRTELAKDGQVSLLVRDAGVGLETTDENRLFQPFYSTKQGGMGIGLSVCRSIVESHGGRVRALRNSGPGATFCVSIPPMPSDP